MCNFEPENKKGVEIEELIGTIPTIEELSEMMQRYKAHLDVYDRHYKYALNKQNGDAEMNREYLLIGW